MTADFDPADFDGDYVLDADIASLDIGLPSCPPPLMQASGLYSFARPNRGQRPASIPAPDGLFDDDVNALTLYSREELRLDIDGRYPQMTVSGTRAGLLGPVANWVASLTMTGTDSYSGQIWFKDGNINAIPHSHVSFKVTKSHHSAQRKVEAIFSGGGAASFARTYRFASPFFRPGEFEYDTVAGATRVTEVGTHDHPNRPASLDNEVLSLETVYRRAGFNVSTAPDGGAIPLGESGADQRWTDQELHDAMQVYWSRFAGKPRWSLWALFASLHVQGDSLGGILFDDIGSDRRRGIAIFTDAFIASPPVGDPDPAAWVRRMRFWAAAHEMGHAFNLAHGRQGALDSPWMAPPADPEARSFMTCPYSVAGGQAAFFADFAYRFSDPELLFMRHAPERLARIGDADWFDDHGFRQVAMEPNAEFALTLSTNARDNRLPYLLPPVVEMALVNRSGRAKLVSAARLSERAGLTLIVKKDGRPARQWSPYARHCGESLEIILGQDEALYDSVPVGAGRNGWDMAEPGRYTIQAMLTVDGRAVISNALEVKVEPPFSREEERLAQDLFTPQVGQVLAAGGTRGLAPVVAVLQAAARMKHHPVARQAALALAGPLADEYKLLQIDERAKPGEAPAAAARRIEVYRPDLKEARHLLSIATDGGADAAVNAVGHARFLREVPRLARALEGGPPPAVCDAARAFDAAGTADALGGFDLGQDMRRTLIVKANSIGI